MAKPKPKKKKQKLDDDKRTSLAQKILSQVIDPAKPTAKPTLEEVIDALAIVAKSLVLINTADDDPVERSDMIDWILSRFSDQLVEIDPLIDRAHLWLIPPQGAITEPFGIFWDGSYDEDTSVKGLLGDELEQIRNEHATALEKTGIVIVEGLDGVANIIPDWDGEDTVKCANPECANVHDVHLMVAEELFAMAIERRDRRVAAN